MTKLYKLTDENDQTYGECQWGEGVTHTASGMGELCTSGWLYAYIGSDDDPEAGALLAVLLNPLSGIHKFDLTTAHLWECEGIVGKTDHGLKVGCISLTTLHRVLLLQMTLEQKVACAILCSLVVYDEPGYVGWATSWLDGTDRSEAAVVAAWVKAEATAAWARAEATTAVAALWAAAVAAANAAAWPVSWVEAEADVAEMAAATAVAEAAVAAYASLPLSALIRRAMAYDTRETRNE